MATGPLDPGGGTTDLAAEPTNLGGRHGAAAMEFCGGDGSYLMRWRRQLQTEETV